MVLDIFINRVPAGLLGHEVMRSEAVVRILVHECDFFHELVDELGADDIEGTLGYFVEMELLAIWTVLLAASEAEEQYVGVFADNRFGRNPHDSIVNEKLAHHPLFALVHILLGAAVVHKTVVADRLVLLRLLQSVIHVVQLETFLLVYFEQIFEQVGALGVVEESLSRLAFD